MFVNTYENGLLVKQTATNLRCEVCGGTAPSLVGATSAWQLFIKGHEFCGPRCLGAYQDQHGLDVKSNPAGGAIFVLK